MGKQEEEDAKQTAADTAEEDADVADADSIADCGEGHCLESDERTCSATSSTKFLAQDLVHCTSDKSQEADSASAFENSSDNGGADYSTDSAFKVDYGSDDWNKDWNADGSSKASNKAFADNWASDASGANAIKC